MSANWAPQVSWGTNPGMVVDVTGSIPGPDSFDSENHREATRRALEYMDLEPGTLVQEIPVDRIFNRILYQFAY